MPNLKEINPREGVFGWLKVTFVKQCEEEKVEENGAFSGTHISQTSRQISFKFGVQGRIYGGHYICEFDINRPSGYRDTKG